MVRIKPVVGIEQTDPVVSKLIAPDPAPPDAVTVIDRPTSPLRTLLVILRAAAAAAKTKCTVGDVADLYCLLAAFVASTAQVVAALARSTPVVTPIEQCAPFTANLTAPAPEPPDTLTLTEVPATLRSDVFVIFKGCWECVELAPAVETVAKVATSEELTRRARARVSEMRWRTTARVSVASATTDATKNALSNT